MNPSTRLFRSRKAALRAVVEKELLRLWPLLDPERVDATFPVWVRRVGALVSVQRGVSATLAARYLRDLGVKVTVADAVPAAVLLRSLEVTGPISIKQGMTAGKLLTVATADAFTASSAAAVRHVLKGGNATVSGSTAADPRVKGWRRVVSPGACDWCRERDGQFLTTPEFACHDGDNCSAEPVTD